MISQLSWKVGGQQGEGIESTGEIFCIALNRLGYYLYGYRHFSSRIKGGHTNNKIRVSTTEVRAISDDLDILIAFDQETIDFNFHELRPGGIVVADAKFNPTIPDNTDVNLYVIPFTDIASELGTSLMKNMVAVGASSAVLGLDETAYLDVVEEIFGRKGEQVVQKNMDAIKRGSQYMKELLGEKVNMMQLEKADGKKRMFMIGNDAIAFGAVAGGARFMSAYPITPASEIMEYLIKKLPKVGGTVIQTEDEIAACTMAIGANYAGVRTLTASAILSSAKSLFLEEDFLTKTSCGKSLSRTAETSIFWGKIVGTSFRECTAISISLLSKAISKSLVKTHVIPRE